MKSEVHNCDCLELMRTLPDNHFQLAIADPPYGGAGNQQFERGGGIRAKIRPLQAGKHIKLDSTNPKDRMYKYRKTTTPTATKEKKRMNKRLAITAQKAIGKGKLLWLDCYNDAIYDTVSPTLKTTTKSSEMNFIMEQGEINETQIPQQDYPKMKTDKMLNVITLFSGYDSQCLALNRLGGPYDLAAWCEIDKYAIKAHNALFPQWKERNLGDVSKVDWAEWHKQHPQPIDMLTYSSPCQDFSSAGLQRGGEEGSGTRSGLLWETERAVRELRPRHLVFENVGGLVSDKFIDLFNRWQARLNGYGYTNFSQLMNAKDYGVPQNRLRIFMVSVLDCQRAYYFPKPFRLERRLKDVLEQNVEERYYLSDDRVAKLMTETEIHRERGNGFAFCPHTPEEIASTVKCSGIGDKTDNYVAEPKVEPYIYGLPHGHYEGDIYTDYAPTVKSSAYTANNPLIETCIAAMRGRNKDNPNDRGKSNDNYAQRLELKTDGTSNTLTSVAKDNLVIEPVSDRQANIKAKVMPNGDIRCYQDIPGKPGISEMQYTNPNNESPTVTCEAQIKVIEPKIIEDFYGTVRDPRVYTDEAPTLRADRTGLMATEGIRIRRLTERELYRLMDVEEKDIDTLLAAPIPRTQHAKLAGNSIVVACLYYIFRNIFVDTEPAAGTQTTLF